LNAAMANEAFDKMATAVLAVLADAGLSRLADNPNAATEIYVNPADWDNAKSTLWGKRVTLAGYVERGHPQIVVTITA
jgi:hypothetical protein